jgi:hypothetical protein
MLYEVAVHRARPQAARGVEHAVGGLAAIPQPNGAVAYLSDNVSNYYKVAPIARR